MHSKSIRCSPRLGVEESPGTEDDQQSGEHYPSGSSTAVHAQVHHVADLWLVQLPSFRQDVPVQHRSVWLEQLPSFRQDVTAQHRSVTRTTTVLQTRRASSTPICNSYNYRPSDKTCQLNTDLWLVQLPSFRQDLPVQHTWHSTYRQLGRHRLRQRLDLVESDLLQRCLNDTKRHPCNAGKSDTEQMLSIILFSQKLHAIWTSFA